MMSRTYVDCELVARVSRLSGIEPPVIVGSQSVYALTAEEVSSVERSRDVDVLLERATPAARRAIGREMGRYSDVNETDWTLCRPGSHVSLSTRDQARRCA